MISDIYVLIQQSRVLLEGEREEAEQARRVRPAGAGPPLWKQLTKPLSQALLRRRRVQDRVGVAECLVLLAGLTASRFETAAGPRVMAAAPGGRLGAALSSSAEDRAERAGEQVARLLGAAEALLDSTGKDLDPRAERVYEHARAIGEGLLGEQGFETAWRLGQAMTLEEATAYALEGLAE